jgi:hypothetical protein
MPTPSIDASLINLLCFLSGLLLGHRLNLLRDRRKEFNDLAGPLRERLLAERAPPIPMRSSLSAAGIDALQFRLFPWHRRGFLRCTERYHQAQQAQQTRDTLGGASYREPKAISATIDALLRYVEPR